MAQQYVSNDIDDFIDGSLYPGGTGTIEDFKYVLWDYNGNQPKDSVLAVECVFVPSDGSNEGKEYIQYWSAGSASDFQPSDDGGHIIAVSARSDQSKSSNWAMMLESLKNNCGLEKGKLNGPDGIRALIGTEITFIRVDQKKRDNLNDTEEKDEKGRKKFTPTTLVAQMATFPWEPKGRKGRTARPTAAAAKTQTAPTATAKAAAATEPAGGSDDVLADAIDAILKTNNPLDTAELPKLLLAELSDTPRAERMDIIKQAKDANVLAGIAESNGWTLTDGILTT